MICAHEEKRLTRRAIRGGSIQYVFQCMACGRSMNQPISHARIKSDPEFTGQRIFDFDEELEARFTAKIVEQSESDWHAKRKAFLSEYGQYLRSAGWAMKRQKVFERCNGVCEGCSEAPATEVHHLTYEHVYEEFLFELVGLCKACHDRIHPDRDDPPSP